MIYGKKDCNISFLSINVSLIDQKNVFPEGKI